MPRGRAPDEAGGGERLSRPPAIVVFDMTWVALVTGYVLVAVMGFERWLLAAGLAVLFALSVGMLRSVLALLTPDELAGPRELGWRDVGAMVGRALFPRLPSGPGDPDAGGRT